VEKLNRKPKVVIILVVAALLLAAIFVAVRMNSKNCRDIIGDGYAMGLDPEPVVIGNTCDQ